MEQSDLIIEKNDNVTNEPNPEIDFSNISNNKKRKKKTKESWNNYGVVTELVKKFKKNESEENLLNVVKALEGIINTFTIIISPGNSTQQIFFNPYMKKFLYLLMSESEKSNITYATYMHVVYRIRWIMRHYSYEDIYNTILCIIINTVKNMRVIDGCDCIYYIQFIAKCQIQNLILKHANDAISGVLDVSDNNADDSISDDGENNEVVDRLQFYYSSTYSDTEDKVINSISDNIDISVLLRDDDIYKYLTYYEKYILYLIEYLGFNDKQILQVLDYETKEELETKIDDIRYKIDVLSNN